MRKLGRYGQKWVEGITKNGGRWIFGLVVLMLVGCNFRERVDLGKKDRSGTENNQLTYKEVLKGDDLIVFVQSGKISIVDPKFPQAVEIFTPQADELPINLYLGAINLSPSKKYLVWYSPNKGIIKYDLNEMALQVLHPPSGWLNQNPQLVFSNPKDEVYFMDTEGKQLVGIDLATNKKTTIDIPYPFGNVFRISPNNQLILFVSGFGQDKGKPQYMLTSIGGETPRRFVIDTQVSKRDLIFWHPDSSGLIALSNEYQLSFISVADPDQSTLFYDFGEELIVNEIVRVENLIYVFGNDNMWRVFDINQHKIVAQMPIEIATELHRPKFIPYKNQSFLIEETLRINPEQFNRLWITDFKGIKKKILDAYHQVSLESETPAL